MPVSPQPGKEVTSLITNIRITAEIDLAPFASWLVTLMLAGARSPGFWSGEIIPPKKELDPGLWVLVQRFHTAEQAQSWRHSPQRKHLLAELEGIPHGATVQVSDETSGEDSVGSVAAAIETQLKPAMESEFWQWEQKIQSTQAVFPGYRGSYLQPPCPGRDGHWASILRFDSPEELEQWFNSDERKKLLVEADRFVQSKQITVLDSSFPGWFPIDTTTGEHPAVWKTALLVLIALYPVLMLQRKFLVPHLIGMPVAGAVALTTIMSVFLTTWLEVPILIKVFSWWLLPGKQNRMRKNVTGGLIASAIFAAEVAMLWHLLPPVS